MKFTNFINQILYRLMPYHVISYYIMPYHAFVSLVHPSLPSCYY